ncbi:DUF2269 family protein [Blastochloris viridis]|uniref:Putative integral membrane protein n=1 Tax=Blastochloris viridis TaxID=1079 RepID=A0A0H5B7F4_BLAVI|nr:DUF2269 domain-containing protein [Blastochloris viridis]ALK08609.1 hypothetical protein BVIR_816 [Blastochloris viridis]BAR98102.1 hypothetical protein BV133_509 [Blastochloris viridis]CUU41272.1 putative integral membrane protein [Blastochloris viridis]
MLYDAFKTLHIFGIIALVGNVGVTAFWKVFANRTGNPQVIAFSQRLVTITDFVFTAGGIVLVYLGGFGAAWASGLDPFKGWLLWGQILFLVSGGIWIAVLVPAQIRMAKLAQRFAAGGDIPDAYWRDNRRWLVWGVVSVCPLLVGIWVMVAKPL